MFESNFAKVELAETEPYRNLVIAESESFVAVPTIGALVEGWLLIVPREPSLSVGALTKERRSELQDFCDEVAITIEATYGPVAIFEHGPASHQTSVGCGVDYAHVHIAPIRHDLLKLSKQMFPQIEWTPAKGLSDTGPLHSKQKSYWYLHQIEYASSPVIGTCVGSHPSQMFRQVIALALGQPTKYDWKTNPGVDLMRQTCERLSQVPA